MAQLKYAHLMKTIPPFKNYGPGSYRQGTEMNGKFLGYDLNIRYGTFYNSGNFLPYQTQVCDYDQMMMFAHITAGSPHTMVMTVASTVHRPIVSQADKIVKIGVPLNMSRTGHIARCMIENLCSAQNQHSSCDIRSPSLGDA